MGDGAYTGPDIYLQGQFACETCLLRHKGCKTCGAYQQNICSKVSLSWRLDTFAFRTVGFTLRSLVQLAFEMTFLGCCRAQVQLQNSCRMQVQATVVDLCHIGCISAFICETQQFKVSCSRQARPRTKTRHFASRQMIPHIQQPLPPNICRESEINLSLIQLPGPSTHLLTIDDSVFP